MGKISSSIGYATLFVLFLSVAFVYFYSLTSSAAVTKMIEILVIALIFVVLAIIPSAISIYYARERAERGGGFKAVLEVPLIILVIAAVLLVCAIFLTSTICSSESCMGGLILIIYGPPVIIGCWLFACVLPALFVKYTRDKEHLISKIFLVLVVLAVLMLIHTFVISFTCSFGKDVVCLMKRAEAKNDMSICEKATSINDKESCYSMIAYDIPQCRNKFSCSQLPEKYRPQCEPYYKGCPLPN